MMIKRRDFIKIMIAAAGAPAIVKAENIMRIVVPNRKIIIADLQKVSWERFGYTKISVYEYTQNQILRYSINTRLNNNMVQVGDLITVTPFGETARTMTIGKIEDHFAWNQKAKQYTRENIYIDPSYEQTWDKYNDD